MATAALTPERIDPRAQHEVRALLTRMGDTLSATELERLCQRVYIRGELWRPLLNLGKERVCECLYLDTCVGVYLISWAPGDDTETHNHSGSDGAVVVAQGTIRAELPDREDSDDLAELRPGTSFCFEDSEPHRIQNAGDLPAATIHCSSPPLEFDEMCAHAEGTAEAFA